MRRHEGFTLIELMIVVAIIGILAAVAIPKFADLLRKSQEGSLKGRLSSLRSAITIYYSDMEGQYPGDLTSLTISGKYIGAIPAAQAVNYHPKTTTIRHNWTTNACGCGGCYMLDTGEWMYWNDFADACAGFPPPSGERNRTVGEVWVLCSHTDTKGTLWTSY